MSQRVNSHNSGSRMSSRRRIRHPALRHYSEEDLEDMVIGPVPSLDGVNPAAGNMPAVLYRGATSRTVRRYAAEMVTDHLDGRRFSSNTYRDRLLRPSRRLGMWRTVSEYLEEQLRDHSARQAVTRNPTRNRTGDEGENEMSIVDETEWMVPAAEGVIEELESQKVVIDGDDVEERECVICLEVFERESELCRLGCSHVFHGDCLRTWLKTSHYCPLCRFELPAK